MMFADDAENDQRGGKQRAEQKPDKFTALGLKKLRKSRGFIGGLGVNGWDGRWEHS